MVCLLLGIAAVACGRDAPAQHVDLDQIRVIDNARLRTDTVGDGRFAETATFVLVDAENASATGAYVTLGGALTDAGGAAIGALKAQSLWIPAGEARTFALVDADRKPRPATTSAQVEVRGALIADPPRARITDLHRYDDHGQLVLKASLVNDAPRIGRIIVIAAFHDREGRPLTRPFSLVELGAQRTQTVQFVGPPGAARGTIYIGDETY